jgi:hypothetical protein
MNQQASRVLIGVVWRSSIAAAYFLGQSGSTLPTPAPPAIASTASQSSGAADAAKTARVVERFSGVPGDAENGGSKSIVNIIARARMEMGSGMNGMMNLRGMLRAIAPLAELDDSELQAALAEVEKTVTEPQQRMMFYSLLLGQWAETNGPAAMAYAEKNVKKGPFDFGIKAAVLGAWARQDPDAVWRWYQSSKENITSDPNSQMTVSAVFAGMASKDLDTALARLNTLEEHERPMALNGIANTAGDARSRKRLLERSETLAPELRRQIQENAIRSWAMMDPEEAIKWIRSRPAEDQPGLRTSAGNMVMMGDPARGAELMMEGVAEKDKPRTYDTIVGQWAYRDPRGAAEWLTKQPQGAELDNARRTFAAVVAQRDPSAAMDWAKSVVNEEQRVSSVQQVYQQWRKRDASAADAALDGSGLAPEKINAFRDAAKTATPTEGR